jgi:hypothetical protein
LGPGFDYLACKPEETKRRRAPQTRLPVTARGATFGAPRIEGGTVRRIISFIAATTIGVACIACGGGDDDDGGATRGADSTATSAPAPSVTKDDALPPLIPQGELTSRAQTPSVHLTLADGYWRLAEDTADAFVIEHDAPAGTEQGFMGVFHVREIRNPENYALREPAPSDMIAWLSAHSFVSVAEPATATTVGGQPGTKVELRVEAPDEVPLFDDFVAVYRDRFQVVELNVNGEHLLVVGGAFNSSNYLGFKPIIEQTLATMRFE